MIARQSCEGRRVWDTARGLWAPAGRGLGAVPLNQWCDQASAWNPLAYMLCLPHDVAVVYGNATGRPNSYPAPPTPPPPNIKLVSTPAAGSVYAGQDNSGSAVYAVPETATDNMARWTADVTAFFDTQGDLTPPTDTCNSWLGLFDSTCPSFTTTLLVGAGLAALLLLGGRR